MNVDPTLKQWATPRQAEIIDAVNMHGGQYKAAKALGIRLNNVEKALRRARKRASIHGYAPGHWVNGTAPGYTMKKVTIQRGPEGAVERTWERQSPEEELREQAIRDAFEAMSEELPRVRKVKPPKHTVSNLCNLYTYTDYHLGMLAWHREGGADWDLKIAEQLLSDTFDRMLASAPDASVCVVNQLGDFLHSDGIIPVTPTSGHILDQDGRFSKIVSASVRVLRRMIDTALLKHEKVVVVMAEGNHDITSSIWLRAMFKALYESEPRVELIDSELPYYVYQHGSVMLAFHHGHLQKNNQLPLLFAAQFPRVWGATTKRYCHTGHRHHEESKEHSGMKVIQHPTLAARDAYAARGGWLSERQATCFTYHDSFGQVGSVTIVPEMFDEAA